MREEELIVYKNLEDGKILNLAGKTSLLKPFRVWYMDR